MRRLPAAVLLLLLTVGCTTGTTKTASPVPAPTSSRPAVAPAASPDEVRLQLLVLNDDGVTLMAVGADHRARTLRELEPPKGFPVAEEVAASPGTRPTACVSWSPGKQDQRRQIACYAYGTQSPRVVAEPRGPGALALREDGGAIAWTEGIEHPSYPTHNLVVAELTSGGTSHLRRVTSNRESCPGECFEGCSPGNLAFAGDDALLLTQGCESDDGTTLNSLSLDDATFRKGWKLGSDGIDPPAEERPYLKYDNLGTAQSTAALVVERGHAYFDDDPPPERAVRVDLRTGRVLEVIATAQKARYVASVTGGARGLVYATIAEFEDGGWVDPRFYVRLPGEKRGSRLAGLPARTTAVVAIG